MCLDNTTYKCLFPSFQIKMWSSPFASAFIGSFLCLSLVNCDCFVPKRSNGKIIQVNHLVRIGRFQEPPETVASGIRIRLECKEYFSVQAGPDTVTCRTTGQWSGNLGICYFCKLLHQFCKIFESSISFFFIIFFNLAMSK